MTNNVTVRGKIALRHGMSPGPHSGITYDIDAKMPDGGIMRWYGQVPSPRRNRRVDIEGLEPGDEVWGFLDGDYANGSAYISWQFQEPVFWGDCGDDTNPVGGGGNPPPPPPPPLTIGGTPATADGVVGGEN